MNEKTKYDLILSIGQACSCTEVLRKACLQFYSYPFDWLYGSNFTERIKLLCNNMENFTNKENLEYIQDIKSTSRRLFRNKVTDISFNHDFEIYRPLDETYPEFEKKYKRRIERMYKQIDKSNKILFVYLQTPNDSNELSEEELINGLNLLKNKLGGSRVSLLYLYSDSNRQYENRQVKFLNEDLTIVKFDYNAHDENIPYKVQYKALNKIFTKFKISNKFLTYKNKFVRLIYLIRILFRKEFWKAL